MGYRDAGCVDQIAPKWNYLFQTKCTDFERHRDSIHNLFHHTFIVFKKVSRILAFEGARIHKAYINMEFEPNQTTVGGQATPSIPDCVILNCLSYSFSPY